MRAHCCPTVASLASLFAKPIEANATPIDLAPLAALSYESLVRLEVGKRVRDAPLALHRPAALFGAPMRADLRAVVPGGGGLDSWQ